MTREISPEARRVRPPALLRPVLLCTALLDELVTGFPVVALPLIRDSFGLSYEQVGLLFTAGSCSSLLFEPAINLLSDRGSKRRPVLSGAFLLVLGFALAAAAGSYLWLLLAFALIYPAAGAAVGLSQATLVDQSLADAPRTMTRWTIMSGVGDLLSPLAVAAAVALGLGWRALFWLAAWLWLALALLIRLQRFPAPSTSDQAREEQAPAGGALASLRAAVCNAALLRWTAILLFASMLDEVFLGFAGLLLRDVVGAEPAAISLALGAQMAGALLGLLAVDRLLGRCRTERLLRGLALLTLLGMVGLLAARSIWPATGALFVIGLGVAGWYPLARAAAYKTMPGRSGAVRTVTDTLGTPFEVALPLLIGLAAGSYGLPAAIAVLGLAPAGVLLLTPRAARN